MSFRREFRQRMSAALSVTVRLTAPPGREAQYRRFNFKVRLKSPAELGAFFQNRHVHHLAVLQSIGPTARGGGSRGSYLVLRAKANPLRAWMTAGGSVL